MDQQTTPNALVAAAVGQPAMPSKPKLVAAAARNEPSTIADLAVDIVLELAARRTAPPKFATRDTREPEPDDWLPRLLELALTYPIDSGPWTGFTVGYPWCRAPNVVTKWAHSHSDTIGPGLRGAAIVLGELTGDAPDRAERDLDEDLAGIAALRGSRSA